MLAEHDKEQRFAWDGQHCQSCACTLEVDLEGDLLCPRCFAGYHNPTNGDNDDHRQTRNTID